MEITGIDEGRGESKDRRKKKVCANWQNVIHRSSWCCAVISAPKICPKCANFVGARKKNVRRKFSHLAEMAAVIPKEFKSNLVSFRLQNETSDTVYHLPDNLHAPTDLPRIKKPGIYLLIHKMCTNAVQIFKSCTEHFWCACDWFNLIKWRQNASGFARDSDLTGHLPNIAPLEWFHFGCVCTCLTGFNMSMPLSCVLIIIHLILNAPNNSITVSFWARPVKWSKQRGRHCLLNYNIKQFSFNFLLVMLDKIENKNEKNF